jgi:hypothetical protein
VNIWLVNHYALPRNASGITRQFDLGSRLAARGHDVTIFASSYDHYTRTDEHLRDGQQFAVEEIEGVRFVWLRTPPYDYGTLQRSRNMIGFGAQLVRWARKVGVPAPGVILGSSPHLLAPLAASHIASRLRVPFVLEVRDVWPASLVELGGPSANHPAVRALRVIERHLYRRADRIVSLLPGAAVHIAERGGDASRVRWVPNGADCSRPITAIPPIEDTLDVMYA